MPEIIIDGRVANRAAAASEWASENPILRAGESGYESDTRKMKIGNGSSRWNNLPYFAIGVTTEAYSGETVNANPFGGFIAHIHVVKEVWEQSEEYNEYAYQIDIPVEGVTGDDTVLVIFTPQSAIDAADAGVLSSGAASEGVVRLYAKNWLSTDLIGICIVWKGAVT
jgi:hypothetical protein